MNRTTGADATALSMAERTSCESSRVCRSEVDICGKRMECVADGDKEEKAPRRACLGVSSLFLGYSERRKAYRDS